MAKKEKEKAKDEDGDDEKDAKAAAEGGGEDGASAEGAEGEGGGGKSKKKLILFTVLPLVILLGAGAAAYFTGALDGLLGKKPAECITTEEGEEICGEEAVKLAEAEAQKKPSVFLEMPDLIVNLNSTSKQPRFLKISVKLEIEEEADKAAVEQVLPRVIDHFQTYLRELRVDDLKGSAGIYRLRLELLSRVKAAVPDAKVSDVLFQEILIQ